MTSLNAQMGWTIAVIVIAALWNQFSLSQLRAEMNKRFDTVDAELRFFHGETGRLTGRVDEISKRAQG